MSKPPFTMSKYMSLTDLLTDKAKYYQEKCAELEAGVKALNELLIECTVEGELDSRLLKHYMEHSVRKELDQ